MSELSPENRALIERLQKSGDLGQTPVFAPFSGARINTLLNAAREEGRTSPPTSEGGA